MKRYLQILSLGMCAFLVSSPSMAQNTYYNSSSQNSAGSSYGYGQQRPTSRYTANTDRASSGTSYSSSPAPLNLRNYSGSRNNNRDFYSNDRQEIVPYGSRQQPVSSPYAKSTEDIIRERERIARELEENAQRAQENYERSLRNNAETVALDKAIRENEFIKDDPSAAYALGLGDPTNLSDEINTLLAEIDSLEADQAAAATIDRSNLTDKEIQELEQQQEKRRKVIYNKSNKANDLYLQRSFSSVQ